MRLSVCPKEPDARFVARRAHAAWALQSGEDVIVVASAASLVRALPPCASRVFAPIVAVEGAEVVDASTGEVLDFESVADALVTRGFVNTGDSLEGPGSFCVRGGTIDVFLGNVPYPVRLDFFGDEVEEIRRIVPSTGQTITSLPDVEIFPVREYRLTKKGMARAMPTVAKRAETDPVWREMFGRLQAGVDFPGADALLPLLYTKTETAMRLRFRADARGAQRAAKHL